MSIVTDERRLARNALGVLDDQSVVGDTRGHTVELPASALACLRTLLEALANGDDEGWAAAVTAMRDRRRNPPVAIEQLLTALSRSHPAFITALGSRARLGRV
jgi:hypothetical protein